MSHQIYPKREICLLDIYDRIQKKDIDLVLKRRYQLTYSRLDRKLNVEFKTANIAKEVKDFLSNKELTYNGKPFRIHFKGNRFLIDGMQDVTSDEVRGFFQNYGEVNNIYFTKRYFATLASITQAQELVEQIKVLSIDGTRVEIKYSFDRNIGNSGSSNRNFEIKNKNEGNYNSKFEIKPKMDNMVNNQQSNYERPIIELCEPTVTTRLSKPVIELGNLTRGDKMGSTQSNLSGSKMNLNGGFVVNNGKPGGINHQQFNKHQQQFMNQQQKQTTKPHQQQFVNQQQQATKAQQDAVDLAMTMSKSQKKKARKRDQSSNSNGSDASSKPDLQQQNSKANGDKAKLSVPQSNDKKSASPAQAAKSVPKPVNTDNTKVNTLKSNPNQPLFSKGPLNGSADQSNRQAGFSALNKLNYNSPDFKPIHSLDDKMSQVHTTTTYYTNNSQQQNPSANLVVGNASVPISSSSNYPSTNGSSKNHNSSPKSNNLGLTRADFYESPNVKYTFGDKATTPKSNPDTIPKQQSFSQPPLNSKTNHFASSKSSKKDDACVIC